MGLKILKLIILIENILCVYRNYSCFSKFKRVFIGVRMTFVCLLAICDITTRLLHVGSNANKSESLYCYLILSDSIILILLACFSTRKFQELRGRINAHYNYFDKNTESLKDISFNILTLMLIINMVKVCISVYFFVLHTVIHFQTVDLILAYMLELNLFMCDLRYIFEVIVIYLILCILSHQLADITKSIATEVDKQIVKDHNEREQTMACKERFKMFNKWSAAYINIQECSTLFNSIFGIQLTFMITTTNLFYIILLYHMTIFSVTGEFTPWRQAAYIISFSLFVLVLCMLSRAAQRLHNNTHLLRRKLCKLLLYSINTPVCYKATKDLLRLVKMRPIHTRAFGSINIDMTLLPTCGALCASYTIIILQFNNVF